MMHIHRHFPMPGSSPSRLSRLHESTSLRGETGRPPQKRASALLLGLSLASITALPSLSGCGLEGVLVDLLDGDPALIVLEDAPVQVVTPTELESLTKLQVYDLQGALLAETLSPEEVAFHTFEIGVPQKLLNGPIRVVAFSGEKVYKGLYFCLLKANAFDDHTVEVSAETTAATLVVESMGTIRGESRSTPALNSYALASYASDELEAAYDAVISAITSGSATAVDFATEVASILDAASSTGTEPVFVPAVSSAMLLGTTTSADPVSFNTAGATLADQAREAITSANIQPELYDAEHKFVTTIFTVSRAGSLENGNCSAYDVCDTSGGKSFDCDPAGTMFFTGAIHADSPIQDPQFEALLGSMTPNQPGWEMFDDGTHGDEVAGDQVFTITYKLPEGMRIFYKYTWGKVGERWTGTEEWPGNNRLLEVKDINGDGYVWRHDNAKDEAYNKDKVNQYLGGTGTVTWDTDQNGDGYLEAQENPIAYDVTDPALTTVAYNGKCYQSFISFVQPTRVAKATEGACRTELLEAADESE